MQHWRHIVVHGLQMDRLVMRARQAGHRSYVIGLRVPHGPATTPLAKIVPAPDDTPPPERRSSAGRGMR